MLWNYQNVVQVAGCAILWRKSGAENNQKAHKGVDALQAHPAKNLWDTVGKTAKRVVQNNENALPHQHLGLSNSYNFWEKFAK